MRRDVRQGSKLSRRLRCGIAAAAFLLAAGTASAQTLEVAVDASRQDWTRISSPPSPPPRSCSARSMRG